MIYMDFYEDDNLPVLIADEKGHLYELSEQIYAHLWGWA